MPSPDAQACFFALADPTRLRIVELLSDGRALRVSDLVDQFDLTRQSLTRHLDVLCDAGITTTRREGRERYTALADDPFDSIQRWLSRYDRFWNERLADLKMLVEKEQAQWP